ncbi:zinc finger protein ZFPM1-like [Rattus rattus]|uniref:zinc finger protein ZFPM1-like n=1 Tax=Rattus rattus TaxID=10117 RepID=UPI0013F2F5BE|nr:zinc finger protein ZFPM1-like [Rattus rattus]
MSRRKQSNPRQIKRSLRDMEAGEEAKGTDISPMEQEATAPEAPAIEEPPSPPREDVSPPTVSAPPESPDDPEDMEGQELEMRPQDEKKEEKEEESAVASPWSGPGNQAD